MDNLFLNPRQLTDFDNASQLLKRAENISSKKNDLESLNESKKLFEEGLDVLMKMRKEIRDQTVRTTVTSLIMKYLTNAEKVKEKIQVLEKEMESGGFPSVPKHSERYNDDSDDIPEFPEFGRRGDHSGSDSEDDCDGDFLSDAYSKLTHRKAALEKRCSELAERKEMLQAKKMEFDQWFSNQTALLGST